MLIYEKAIKHPMKIVCESEVITKIQQMSEQQISALDCHQPSLACDSSAIPRVSDSIVDEVTQLTLANPTDLDWLPHSYLIYPNILKRIHDNEDILVDEKTKEQYINVDFRNVDKFVPQEMYA